MRALVLHDGSVLIHAPSYAVHVEHTTRSVNVFALDAGTQAVGARTQALTFDEVEGVEVALGDLRGTPIRLRRALGGALELGIWQLEAEARHVARSLAAVLYRPITWVDVKDEEPTGKIDPDSG
ncbi:MAG: hypothetical protein U1E65_36120 [Myxococcota bacterium]